jgi:alpha-tubulin suppressor-like RCC1 family protein
VAVLGGLKISSLARLGSGALSVIAVQGATGAAYAWGNNSYGQLGVGDVIPRSSPVAVLGGLKISSLLMGDRYAYGFAGDGLCYAWGLNDVGQLGDGSTVSKSSPVAVQGLVEPLFEIPIIKGVSVIAGQTYVIRLGGGACFFDKEFIGKNIRRAIVAFEK